MLIAAGAVPAQANGSAEAVAPVTSLPAEEALSAVLAFIHGVGCELTATAELGPEAGRPRCRTAIAFWLMPPLPFGKRHQ